MGKRKRGREGEKEERIKRVIEGVKPEDAIHVAIYICRESCIVLGTRGKGGGRWGLAEDESLY